MKIGFGADNNAFRFKEELKQYVAELGHEVIDFGAYDEKDIDYPNIAFQVATAINNKEIDRGILCCGTGIGMAIAANKVPGIRAAQVFDTYASQRAQLSNNAQIITFGAFVQGIASAKVLTKEYLANQFQPGTGSERKIEQITEYEQQQLQGE